jgi:hypothetical protein
MLLGFSGARSVGVCAIRSLIQRGAFELPEDHPLKKEAPDEQT